MAELMEFVCPICRAPFRVDGKHAGGVIMCPSCDQPVKIPAPAPPAAEAPGKKPALTRKPLPAIRAAGWCVVLAIGAGATPFGLWFGLPLAFAGFVLSVVGIAQGALAHGLLYLVLSLTVAPMGCSGIKILMEYTADPEGAAAKYGLD